MSNRRDLLPTGLLQGYESASEMESKWEVLEEGFEDAETVKLQERRLSPDSQQAIGEDLKAPSCQPRDLYMRQGVTPFLIESSSECKLTVHCPTPIFTHVQPSALETNLAQSNTGSTGRRMTPDSGEQTSQRSTRKLWVLSSAEKPSGAVKGSG